MKPFISREELHQIRNKLYAAYNRGVSQTLHTLNDNLMAKDRQQFGLIIMSLDRYMKDFINFRLFHRIKEITGNSGYNFNVGSTYNLMKESLAYFVMANEAVEPWSRSNLDLAIVYPPTINEYRSIINRMEPKLSTHITIEEYRVLAADVVHSSGKLIEAITIKGRIDRNTFESQFHNVISQLVSLDYYSNSPFKPESLPPYVEALLKYFLLLFLLWILPTVSGLSNVMIAVLGIILLINDILKALDEWGV